MAVAALIVAIVAVVLSLLSYLHTRAATAKAERDRREELDLQRAEFDARLEERERSKKANISGRSVSRTSTPYYDEHQILVHNAGPATARDLRLTVRDEQGQRVVAPQIISVLPAGETLDSITLQVPTLVAEQPIWLVAAWTDDAGLDSRDLAGLGRIA